MIIIALKQYKNWYFNNFYYIKCSTFNFLKKNYQLKKKGIIMHKKIFFIIAVILINKNIMPSLSESNIDRDSDTIPYSIDADIDTDINTDRGSDTSEMPPIGRITNPRQITNSTIYHPTSEITPVVERIVHQRQNRSRIQPTIADQQRKDRILHTITRILSIANSGYIRSIPMDYRKTLTIAPREGESIT